MPNWGNQTDAGHGGSSLGPMSGGAQCLKDPNPSNPGVHDRLAMLMDRLSAVHGSLSEIESRYATVMNLEPTNGATTSAPADPFSVADKVMLAIQVADGALGRLRSLINRCNL